jgi:hypothetical protein
VKRREESGPEPTRLEKLIRHVAGVRELRQRLKAAYDAGDWSERDRLQAKIDALRRQRDPDRDG